MTAHLLFANTTNRVLADVSLTIGWKQQSRCYVNLASARHDLRGLPAASFAPGLSPIEGRAGRCPFRADGVESGSPGERVDGAARRKTAGGESSCYAVRGSARRWRRSSAGGVSGRRR
jgi:hypothetical protein